MGLKDILDKMFNSKKASEKKSIPEENKASELSEEEKINKRTMYGYVFEKEIDAIIFRDMFQNKSNRGVFDSTGKLVSLNNFLRPSYFERIKRYLVDPVFLEAFKIRVKDIAMENAVFCLMNNVNTTTMLNFIQSNLNEINRMLNSAFLSLDDKQIEKVIANYGAESENFTINVLHTAEKKISRTVGNIDGYIGKIIDHHIFEKKIVAVEQKNEEDSGVQKGNDDD